MANILFRSVAIREFAFVDIIPFILAVNWLMTIVLKFQEIIDFFQEHRNPAGALKVSIVSPEISCSKVMLGC